jgi:hypothetical protein
MNEKSRSTRAWRNARTLRHASCGSISVEWGPFPINANTNFKTHPPRMDQKGKTSHNTARATPRHFQCRSGAPPKWVLEPGRQFRQGREKTDFGVGLFRGSPSVISQPAFIARCERSLRGLWPHFAHVLAIGLGSKTHFSLRNVRRHLQPCARKTTSPQTKKQNTT